MHSLRSLFRPEANCPKLYSAALIANSQVIDSPGWASLTSRPHDYDPAQVQDIYQDALTAWRKNPIAWHIIAITTDYVVGDTFSISSTNKSLNKPQNSVAINPTISASASHFKEHK